MDINFKADYNFLIIILILVISAAISYFYYRKSKLDSSLKKLFYVLRTLSVFFLLLLFLSPVISLFSKSFRAPVNVFLLDNSESLLIENRFEKLKEEAESNGNGGDDNSENKYYLFSGNLFNEINYRDIKNIEYTGPDNFSTNLSNTFTSLQDLSTGMNLSSVTVISDGMFNEGGNPVYRARSLNVPVNYFLIGDTIQKNDLVLKNVFYNKTSFIESTVPIKAVINSFNIDRTIKVNLFEDNRISEVKEIKVIPGQAVYNVDFKVRSNSESVKKYRIEIEPEEDEITDKNNFEEFFIKYTDNKFKLLVLSGGPSPDFAFISDELKKVKNFEAKFLTQKTGNEFYEGTFPFKEVFDSYILIGYPTSVTDPVYLNEIRENISRDKSSLILFSSRNTDYGKLSLLDEYIPFTVSNYSPAETETKVSAVSSINRDLFSESRILSEIKNLPGIFKTQTVFTVKPSAETVLISENRAEPAMIIQNTSDKKSMAFLVYGFYKWRLNNRNINFSEIMTDLLTNYIIKISGKDARKKFIIETTKPVYSKYENVIFNARLNNIDHKGSIKIRVNIKGSNFNKSIDLIQKSNSVFENQIRLTDDGDYEYDAELITDNVVQETYYNKFGIGTNNFEYKSTRADNEILSSLSAETGGVNFSNIDASSINDSLRKNNRKSADNITSFKKFELNINPYYLFGLILVLCMEWFLRKRNNLP